MSKLGKVKGYLRIFHVTKNLLIACLILGFGMRHLSIPGGYFFITVGCLGYAMLLIIALFEKPKKEYNWAKVFPELLDSNE